MINKTLKDLSLNDVKIGSKVKIVGGLGIYEISSISYSCLKGNICYIINSCGNCLLVKFEDLEFCYD